MTPASMPFAHIYIAFAAGYFLSTLYRTVNAVISPDLTAEFGLDMASLGLLTSAYFLAFGLAQVPAGMLLDRYGPRRVEPAMLAIAAVGSIGFGLAQSLTGLVAARALIGLGVCVCLMAPLKAIAVWYPPDRQASLLGWIMAAGGVGALAATAPLELVLRATSWHTVFIGLGVVTIAVALLIGWRVPDIPAPPHAIGFAAQWAGVRQVFAHPRFWWIAPLGGVGMGAFMSIQGLWAVPWMIDVDGRTRADAARHLLVMGVVVMAGYTLLGMFATRLARGGFEPKHLFASGFALNFVALGLIIAETPGSYLWWSLYGLGAAVNVLGFPVLSEGFPKELAARASTALNLMMFVGSFAAQWGIGVIVEAARAHLGLATPGALRLAFGSMFALITVAFGWFVLGWRRHAPLVRANVPA
jgi:MFS family permease